MVRDASLRDAPHHEVVPCNPLLSPVNRHGNRRPGHQEQGRWRGFTGVGPCFFLLIQAKYRGFTGTAPSVPLRRPADDKKPPEVFCSRAQFQLWIFSYTILARLAKNELSRLFIASGPPSRQRRPP